MDRDDRNDAIDVAETLRGDGDAYRRIVERHQADLSALMSRFARDAGELEELVEDAFVEAWRSLGGFDATRPFRPWLRAVAVHVGYRYWRSRSRGPGGRTPRSLEDVGDVAAAPEAVPAERAEEVLHRLLAGLPPRDRLVLTLIYLEGASVAQAAELTGWSRTMVKVQAHRARAKLRRLVDRVLSEGW